MFRQITARRITSGDQMHPCGIARTLLPAFLLPAFLVAGLAVLASVPATAQTVTCMVGSSAPTPSATSGAQYDCPPSGTTDEKIVLTTTDVTLVLEDRSAFRADVGRFRGNGDIDVEVTGGTITISTPPRGPTMSQELNTAGIVATGRGQNFSVKTDGLTIRSSAHGGDGIRVIATRFSTKFMTNVDVEIKNTDIEMSGSPFDIVPGGMRYQETVAGVDVRFEGSVVDDDDRARTAQITVDEDSRVVATGPAGLGISFVESDDNNFVESDDNSATGTRFVAVVNGLVMGGPRGGPAGRESRGVGVVFDTYASGRVMIGPTGVVGAGEDGLAISMGHRNAPEKTRQLIVEMATAGRKLSDIVMALIENSHGQPVILVFDGATLYDSSQADPVMAIASGMHTRSVEGVLQSEVGGSTFISLEDARVTLRVMPSASIYEAFPGALLRLDGSGDTVQRLHAPGSPLWISLNGGRGSFKPKDDASLGARYDIERYALEIGLDVPFGESLTGWAAGRYIKGSSDTSPPDDSDAGRLEVKGYGGAVGLDWRNAYGLYAEGWTSLTRYRADLSSGTLGALRENADVTILNAELEAGLPLSWTEVPGLTSRAWLHYADAMVDNFTDTMGNRISVGEASRLKVGVGVGMETSLGMGEGALAVRGELGAEHTLDGRTTEVTITSELGADTLRSEAPATRPLANLGAAWHVGDFTWDASVGIQGLGLDDTEYTGRLELRAAF